MENLPVEIVTHVMRFLNASDREVASLVCKTWYEASLDPCLHTRTVIKLKASTTAIERMKGLSHRKSPHLVVLFVEGGGNSSWVVTEMARHLGLHLKTLSLCGCDVIEDMFINIVKHCPNLHSLDLSCCNSLFMSGNFLSNCDRRETVTGVLKKLKKLKLNSVRYLSDVLFNRLLDCTPRLECLSLCGCNIAFETDPCNKENKDSISFLTFTNLKRCFEERSDFLREIDFSNTLVTSQALKELSTIPNLKLKSLILNKCNNLSDKGLVAVANSELPLESLSFTQCSNLTFASVASVTENLHSLRELTFSDMRIMPDAVTASLFSSLPNLCSLSISSYALTSKGICSGLRDLKHSSLTKLDLGGCAEVDDDGVRALAEAGLQLRELSLRSCRSVSDVSVSLIPVAFPELRKLNLSWCTLITDFGVLGLEKDSPSFEPKKKQYHTDRFSRSHGELGFFTAPTFEEKITSIGEKELEKAIEARGCKGLTQLSRLEYLDLSNCPHLTDLSFEKGLSFPNLRNFQLAFCRNLTDNGLKALANSNPNLEVLNLSHCHLITNDSLTVLVSSIKTLIELNLTACNKLGNKSLEIIAENCRRLKSINLSMCGMISVGAIKRLQQSIPTLQTVEFGHTGSYLAPLSHPDFF